MKEGYYQIGEVSQITGISRDTLHFYDKIGLLCPDCVEQGNRYRYYSRWNLWQLDIITACRKLNIPLEKVKQILSLRDNEKIIGLLMQYREEALRLSRYYRQVADDIVWYSGENDRILRKRDAQDIQIKCLEKELVIVGGLQRNRQSYHANLQEAAKDELGQADSIRRKYGYILDAEELRAGNFVKCREYLKLKGSRYTHVAAENQYHLPAGRYAVFTLHIRGEKADFAPFLAWLKREGQTVDAIFAEELGLQLFEYLEDYYCEIKAHLKKV